MKRAMLILALLLSACHSVNWIDPKTPAPPPPTEPTPAPTPEGGKT